MKNQIQLITDIDHLSNGGFNKLNNLSNEPLSDILGEDHLPHVDTPVDGSDAGSDPVNHTKLIEITKKLTGYMISVFPLCYCMHLFIRIQVA